MARKQNNGRRRKPEATPKEKENNAQAVLDRALPHDEAAERALLGSMLQRREAIGEAITVLRDASATAFDAPKHQDLFDVLVHFYTEELPVDSVPLRDELTRRDLWDKLGGYGFLAGLVNAVPSALRARHYAGIVRDKYLLRQLIGATHEVMQAAFDNQRSVKETLDLAEKEIFAVTEQRVSGEAAPLAELVKEVFHTLDNRGENPLTGEPTGFTLLDECTCGLQPGELIIVAGRPSMGKTALGLNMAEHLAITEHRPVLFFSLEMSRQQVAQRILCSRARVDAHRLRRGRVSSRDLEDLQRVANDLSTAPLLVDETADLSILELRARARIAHRKHKIRAIFVDYLQLMRYPRAESRQVEVAHTSRGLKALAKDLGIPVIAMAQLNRNPEDKSRRGNRPRMADLRESGSIEQDADVVALIHRESYFKPGGQAASDEGSPMEPPADQDPDENTTELIIAKQRNGPTGTIKLHWNRHYTRFDNHDPRGHEPEGLPRYDGVSPF